MIESRKSVLVKCAHVWKVVEAGVVLELHVEVMVGKAEIVVGGELREGLLLNRYAW